MLKDLSGIYFASPIKTLYVLRTDEPNLCANYAFAEWTLSFLSSEEIA